jgi:putative ABC transport system substrate-binding protein
VKLLSVEFGAIEDLESAVAAMVRERAEALFLIAAQRLFGHRRQVMELALRNRLPASCPTPEYVEAGGLMSYAPNTRDLYRRSAVYVDISKHVGRVNRESIVVDEIGT